MSALHTRLTVAAAGLLTVTMVVAACSPSASNRLRLASSTGFVVTPQLWGEMKPIVSVKELMCDMLIRLPTTSSTRSR